MRREMARTAMAAFLAGVLFAGGWMVMAALREDPGGALLRRGDAALAAGSWEEAERHLTHALASRRPDVRTTARHNLGLVHLHAALWEEGPRALERARAAVRELEAALRLAPGLQGAAWNLELALRRGQELEAGEAVEKALEAEKLLASLRLTEQEGVGEMLRARLRDGAKDVRGGGSASPERGPPW